MSGSSIKGLDRRVHTLDALERVGGGNTHQEIAITDIVSEGEIRGLVNGGSSIYVDDDSLFENDEATYHSASINATGLANSVYVTLSAVTGQTAGTSGTRFLVIKDALETTVSLSEGVNANL